MMRRLLPLSLFLIIALVMGIKLVNTDSESPSSAGDALIGQAAPTLTGTAPTEDDVAPSPEKLKNTPYLINFYASWCVPCQAEHPLLMKLMQDKQILIIGIAWKDEQINTVKHLTKLGNPYTYNIMDTNSNNAINYGITAVPETFVVDAKGTIVEHIAGPLTSKTITSKILPHFAP